MATLKPNLFIGSSRESIPYARAIHEQISWKAQVTPWYGGTFGANSYTMEALERQLDVSDFGVFVFAPDDVALIRGKHVFITRDNTLFEMGLFWGKLRRARVFCLVPREVRERNDLLEGVNVKDFHLLSDLQGLTLLTYEVRTDGNYNAAVDVACGHIMSNMERLGLYQDPATLVRSQQSVLHFFWEYNRNIRSTDPIEKYQALTEAVRNSLLSPNGFRVTGAAVWQKIGSEGIAQVGGNVGRGQFFPFHAQHESSENQQKIYVVDAYLSGQWTFFKRMQVAHVYVLCYPLGTENVLSVHISGQVELSDPELSEIVSNNTDLLRTINYLVGGDA